MDVTRSPAPAPAPASRDAAEYRELPRRIAVEDMIETHETRDAPDPTMGRDTETEFLLRNAE